jgi:hypothetical protein
MASWPSSLPLFRVGYRSNYSNATRRTSIRGKKSQRKITNRKSEIVGVSLTLTSDQLAEFEYFAIVVLNNCVDKFTGSYWDNGLQTDNIEFTGGYQVSTLGNNLWSVTSEIEVFR